MPHLLSLPNYINGSFKESSETRILKDYMGNDFAVIYNVSNSDLREIKRNLPALRNELKKIKLEKIINLIKKSMEYYFAAEESYSAVSKLTGSPHNFVKISIKELKQWALSLQDYIKMCFNSMTYDEVPLVYEGEVIAYEKYVPAAPVIGILPKNSEAESVYLLLQILLSKNPCIIKTSSSLGSSFSSLELIKALNKAIGSFNDPELEIIRKSINIVNIFNSESERIIKKLEVENGIYVIFGSNETIKNVQNSLKNSKPYKIIKMGTGFSISIVLHDADIPYAADEICTSASIDRGNDCVSTNIVYVEESVFDSFVDEVRHISHKYESKDPFADDNVVGYISKEDVDIIKARLSALKSDAVLKGLPDTIHLSVIELEEHNNFEEFPGPILGIRKFQNMEHFYRLFKKDLEKNDLDKNLVSSIFTKDNSKFHEISDNISSFTFKLNKGSQKMNFLLEHQGTYLIKELLDKRILEKR